MKIFKVFILLIIIALNNCITSLHNANGMKRVLHLSKLQKRYKAKTKFIPFILAAIIIVLYATQKAMENYILRLNEERLSVMKNDHIENQLVISRVMKMEMTQCSNANIYISINKYINFAYKLNSIFEKKILLKQIGGNINAIQILKDTEDIEEESEQIILNMEKYSKKLCNQEFIYGSLESEDEALDARIKVLTEGIENSEKWYDGVALKVISTVSIASGTIKTASDDMNLKTDPTEAIKLLKTKSTLVSLHSTAKVIYDEINNKPEKKITKALSIAKTVLDSIAEIVNIISLFTGMVTAIVGKCITFVSSILGLIIASMEYHEARTAVPANPELKEVKLTELLKSMADVMVNALMIFFDSIGETIKQGVETFLTLLKLIRAKRELKSQLEKREIYRRLRSDVTILSERFNDFNNCQVSFDTLVNINILFPDSEKNNRQIYDTKNFDPKNFDLDLFKKELANLCEFNIQFCSRTLSATTLPDDNLSFKKQAIYAPYSDITLANYENEILILIQIGYEPIDFNFDSTITFPKLFGCRKCSNKVIIDAVISTTSLGGRDKCNKFFDPEVCRSQEYSSLRLTKDQFLVYERIIPGKMRFYPAVNKIFYDTIEVKSFAVKLGIYNTKTGDYENECTAVNIENKYCQQEFYSVFSELKIEEANPVLYMHLEESMTERPQEYEKKYQEFTNKVNKFELGRQFDMNFISFSLSNKKLSNQMVALNAYNNFSKVTARRFTFVKNYELSKMSYNWITAAQLESPLLTYLKENFSDFKANKVEVSMHSYSEDRTNEDTYSVYSFSPLSTKTSMTPDIFSTAKLCTTLNDKCKTSETSIEKSIDTTNRTGAKQISEIFEFNRAIGDGIIEDCLWVANSSYKVCKVISKCKIEFDGLTTDENGVKVKCLPETKQRHKSDNYVVLFDKKLTDLIKLIVFSRLIGQDQFISSEPESTSKFMYFISTKIDIRDNFIPIFNLHSSCGNILTYKTTGNLFKTMTEVNSNFILASNITEEVNKYRRCSGFTVLKKVQFGTKRRKMISVYRKISIENNKVRESFEKYGPGLRKFYFIVISDKNETDREIIYNTNYGDATIFGYVNIGTFTVDKLFVTVWVAYDFRVMRNLAHSCKDLAPSIQTIPELKVLKDAFVVSNYFLVNTSKGDHIANTLCSKFNALDGAIIKEALGDSKSKAFDLRKDTLMKEFVYVCQKKEMRSNASSFISYKRPPIVLQKNDNAELFERNFPSYKCMTNDKKPSMIVNDVNVTYDLARGLSNFHDHKYLCISFTTDISDEGIKDIVVYPTRSSRTCEGNSIFRMNNYECNCNGLNTGTAGFAVYMCYIRGDII